MANSKKAFTIKFLLYCIQLCLNLITYGQRNCGFSQYQEAAVLRYPSLKTIDTINNVISNSERINFDNQVITIPIAVHIVYKRPEENVSDMEVTNQIRILNEDYSGKNLDLDKIPPSFKKYIAGDCKIKFKLVATTRTLTKTDSFLLSFDNIKSTALGGHDAGTYSSNRYLNIWVGNIAEKTTGDLLGYATYPGTVSAMMDGVVIYYKVFGTPGLDAAFDRGRTATHEIGHWLGLYHIWGKTGLNNPDCASDEIDDTPTQKFSNQNCPIFPKTSCNNSPDGEMFMNYMDYVDDPCMIMFTTNQKEKMRGNFLEGGARVDIIRGNTVNYSVISNDSSRSDLNTPVVMKFSNDSLTWKPVKGARSYTISLKPLGIDTTFTFTTKKLTTTIKGLDLNKIYEIIITATQSNNGPQNSNPILIQPLAKEEKIKFKD